MIVEIKHIVLATDDSWVLTSNYKGIGNPKLASSLQFDIISWLIARLPFSKPLKSSIMDLDYHLLFV